MNKKLARKEFLKQMVLSAASVMAVPFSSFAYSNTKKQETMNSTKKSIKKIRPLGFQWETLDPFLFCVHHEDKFPKGNGKMGPAVSLSGRSLGDDFIIKDGFRMYHGKRIPGFPGHPHRGFETITVVREGMVDHADSLGAAGRYGDGDVQWMTAGKGVQHSEMFPLLSDEKQNPLELFQIWLNLPRKSKMVEPHFKMLWSEGIPRFKHSDMNGLKTEIEVIAGKMDKHQAATPPPNSWAADPNNHVAVWNIHMDGNAEITLPKTAAGINRSLYYYVGNTLKIDGTSIPKYNAIDVESDMDILLQAGSSEAKILVLQGRPINETVIQYGPFVMNSKEEIQQAFEDYHQTKFGGWPWPVYDQVHDKSQGRFAKHADGTLELKS